MDDPVCCRPARPCAGSALPATECGQRAFGPQSGEVPICCRTAENSRRRGTSQVLYPHLLHPARRAYTGHRRLRRRENMILRSPLKRELETAVAQGTS